MNQDIESFANIYAKAIQGRNAAIFAGAGLSVATGYVDWKKLLKPIADDLHIDLDVEKDLVAVAQYHCNQNGGNRHKLSELIIDRFASELRPTENHLILARLPIEVYWTTNYDRLIEDSLKSAGKTPDVKYTNPQLSTTLARRDAVVYKMHGDVGHPHEAVLIKDDYEKYFKDRSPFVTALAGDLVSKTFLFLGFSFTDPNLDYILSRVRISFDKHQRQHFCISKRRTKLPGESDAMFQQAKIKQEFTVEDLKRFNIKTILVDEYAQITEILSRVERIYKQRNIFISGSAAEYGKWTKESVNEFLANFGQILIQSNYHIVTGFGLGVADAIITGAMEEIYTGRSNRIDDSLTIRPFPRAHPDLATTKRLWEECRQGLISKSGICLFLFGNKDAGGNVELAAGVRREFEIALEHGAKVVPVAATGYMAEDLWKEVMSSFDKFYPGASVDLIAAFKKLGEPAKNPADLTQKIMDVVKQIGKE